MQSLHHVVPAEFALATGLGRPRRGGRAHPRGTAGLGRPAEALGRLAPAALRRRLCHRGPR